jgi:hypothetical protein
VSIKWKKKFKPEFIIQSLDKARKIDSTRGVTLHGFSHIDDLAVLETMLDFPDSANEFQKSTLIWHAIKRTIGILNKSTFIQEINSVLSEKLATSDTIYKVAASVSLDRSFQHKSIKIDSCTLKFLPGNLPNKIIIARDEFIAKHFINIEKTSDTYTKIIITVKAKSPDGAMTRALDALDTLRAIWCLQLNSSMQIFGDPRTPINEVRLGSLQTIHNQDGSMAIEKYWFEPNFKNTTPYLIKHPKIFLRNNTYLLTKLSKSKYKPRLINALLKYVRALDENDQNTAFIRIWTALESLTSPERADYVAVVRRTSFLFKNREYSQQLLEHLREQRNTSIHAGDQNENAKTHCFQLQAFFYKLIIFHLSNYDFKSLDEANLFLDFDSNVEVLRRQRQLLNRAILFHSGPKKKSGP